MIRALLPLLILLTFAPPSAAQAPEAPMVKPEGLAKLSDHVWAIPDNSVPAVSNIGIVVGATGALVIDTGLGPKNGEIVLAAARKLAGNRKLYLAITHFHPEHDLGAQAFPASTTLIRSEDQVKDIAEFGPAAIRRFADRSAPMAELLNGAEFRKADVTFAKAYRLDLGGVSVRLMAMGPNHTRGDTAIFVEPDRVLFSGDVVMTELGSATSPYSSISNWLTSLDRLEALKPRIIVPSHGPNGDASLIARYRAYFTAVRDGVAKQKAKGLAADPAARAVAAELKDRYPEERVTATAKVAYVEAPSSK